MDESYEPLKIQTTIRGYPAWAVDTYRRKKNLTMAEVVTQIVESWLRSERLYLKEEFEISIRHYEKVNPLMRGGQEPSKE